MPKVFSGLACFDDPLNAPIPPATVWRVRRLNREVTGKYSYSLLKVIEDRDGEVLPGTTTVIHDALTGRLFMSGRI
jgi:arylesterase/paraoxonase